MKLLADENVPLEAVIALRASGFDVVWIGHVGAGMPDGEVLRLACEEERVLITLDRDFGELVFLREHRPPPAVVLIRAPVVRPVPDLAMPLEALLRHEKIEGFFWILGRENWRRRPL